MTLPQGWSEATFADIATQRSGNGKLIKGKLAGQPGTGMFPAFSASGQDVWRDAYDGEGDAIIVSAVGARCGKAFRACGKWSAIANTHIVRAEDEAVDVDYLFLILNDEHFWEKGGTAQPFVKVTATFQRSVALPPLAEQRRIVAKLDALTARLVRARAELDRVPVLAAKLRAAVLSEVFSPPASVAAVATEYDPAIDGRTLPVVALPAGWQWMALGSVATVSGGLTKNATRAALPLQVPYLRVANVYANSLMLEDVATIGCTAAEMQRTSIAAGDILVVEGNGSLSQVGRAAIWNEEITNCSHQNHLIRVRASDTAMPEYVLWWLLSPEGRQRIERLAASTSGLHTLSLSKVAGIPIPLPSIAVQERAVARIKAVLARADRLEAEASRALALIDRLEAAILARALRGELVPQDPADEPASVLLERIRAERAVAPKAKRGRKRAVQS